MSGHALLMHSAPTACTRQHALSRFDSTWHLQAWNALILLLDAVYTALWVPIVSTFDLPHGIDTAPGATDFAIGIVLMLDIFLRFHAPIRLTSTYKQLSLTQPRTIAHFYVLRCAAFAWLVALLGAGQAALDHACSRLRVLFLVVYDRCSMCTT